MRYTPLNKDFFVNNRQRLIAQLNKDSLMVLFSPDEYTRNGDQYYPFRQNSDLYYLTGIDQEETSLMISTGSGAESVQELLFVKEVDDLQRIWYGEKHSREEANQRSGIANVQWNKEFENQLCLNLEGVHTIYYVETPVHKSFDENASSNMRRIERLKKDFPEKEFVSISPLLQEMRLVKTEEEINAIEKAVEITRLAYVRILNNIAPDKYEYEIEAEMTYAFLKNGAQGHAYAPIVAAGKNACILHYVDNDKIMKDGDLLLLDFGAEYANYAADCSRTIPVNGKFTERQKECYQAVLEVFEKAKKMYVPGNTINKINEQVGVWMQEKMITLGLFTQADVDAQNCDEPLYKKYFMHGTAHFIGLDVHDVGAKDTVFKKGMVLSCEPALYIEEEGIGIRIETDMLVDEIPVDLMNDFPLTVREIENAM